MKYLKYICKVKGNLYKIVQVCKIGENQSSWWFLILFVKYIIFGT